MNWSQFAQGTTCARDVRLVREWPGHFLIHHRCHKSYVDRMTGSVTHHACRQLFRKTDFTDIHRLLVGDLGAKPIKEWRGRWNKRLDREANALVFRDVGVHHGR